MASATEKPAASDSNAAGVRERVSVSGIKLSGVRASATLSDKSPTGPILCRLFDSSSRLRWLRQCSESLLHSGKYGAFLSPCAACGPRMAADNYNNIEVCDESVHYRWYRRHWQGPDR